MFIRAVILRFYKSFSFDYLRKVHHEAKPHEWELIEGNWFPFVRIQLERDVTTVVGANESGKSQLLGAIEKALQGVDWQEDDISIKDFCRYSPYFSVRKGAMRFPDIGLEIAEIGESVRRKLIDLLRLQDDPAFDEFVFVRTAEKSGECWISLAGKSTPFKLEEKLLTDICGLLPRPFRLDADVAIPDSVPIVDLVEGSKPRLSRNVRSEIMEALEAQRDADAERLAALLRPVLSKKELQAEIDRRSREVALARDLLFKVAQVDEQAIRDLRLAIRLGDQALANGLCNQINERLAETLNFPKRWVQDREFRLLVSPRDLDLVFTIRDRTQQEYSFGERSSGLKYFLSYYVQFLSHDSNTDTPEILLMDEPDAFLSSQGQQDLLAIFNDFAFGARSGKPAQVVYVTHSPFLIDRNRAARIRVLEKGVGDEGTRVVHDASRNHYEPLRSALGVFVGEVAFIGNCNLLVEGLSDQILLVAASEVLRRRKAPATELLDLNTLTVCPCGSAGHIPYMALVARGRDIDKPAVVVLLDSDTAGRQARKVLRRGGASGRAVIKPNHTLMLDEVLTGSPFLTRTDVEMEDLIPTRVAATAACAVLSLLHQPPDGKAWSDLITEAAIVDRRTTCPSAGLFDAIASMVAELTESQVELSKVAFARAVFDLVSQDRLDEPALRDFGSQFRPLLRAIGVAQRSAMADFQRERVTHQVGRIVGAFLRDHARGARWDEIEVLVETIDRTLDDSDISEAVRSRVHEMRLRHRPLTEDGDPREWLELKTTLVGLQHTGKTALPGGVPTVT